ncbi:DUF5684 domain-containing protein [Chitinophaga agri]|uniref:Signal peptidase I n=1 Tax=Chitinophaga agri TaxID=2703787 RepID=A0A6B9ZM53_9BACT|nr:DUF5684 domain-containing protein [Chitinophaga agri]QHS62504.1 hypothetical protein GWR21_23815 [Chitinophaga agri]
MQDVSSYESADAGAVLAGLGFTFFLFFIGIMVFYTICNWKIFTKAGKPGWACLVPIYGTIVMLEIVGKPWWYIFMFMIPIYGWFVLPIQLTHHLSKSFGKDVGFTLGLLFLGFIFVPLLAFSSDIQYVGPYGNPGGQSLDNQIGSIGNPAV